MEKARAAYRVFDNDTIAPIGSEVEREVLEQAFADLAAAEFHGARAHLRSAAEQLAAGRWADSIRESIHAVESVTEMLEPSGRLSEALAKLEASASIHGGMKRAFLALYGHTSDEQGVRHALDTPGECKSASCQNCKRFSAVADMPSLGSGSSFSASASSSPFRLPDWPSLFILAPWPPIS